MKKAEIDHAWTECRKANRAQLSLASFKVRYIGGSDELIINSRISSFIGPNGAGKTRLLKNLFSILTGTNGIPGATKIEQIQGNFRGENFVIESDQTPPPANLNVEYVDIAFHAHNSQHYLNGQSHLEELLEQYEPNLANQTQLGVYRHVCGRFYDSVSVRELDGPAAPQVPETAPEDSDDFVFPFFEVTISGIQYDNRSMGFGELCACYLVWKVHRTRTGTAILLDEPDSHLSPTSRRALIDALAIFAKERQLWIAFTTHSIELLDALQEHEIFLVYSDTIETPPRIAPAENKRHAIRSLGLAPQRRIMIAVEDIDALAATWFMLNRWGSDITSNIDVQIVTGGANEVSRFVSLFPSPNRICHAIAILDGDKRNDYHGLENIFFLPGESDPVAAAIAVVRQDCQAFAERLGADPLELRRSLTAIAHVDHHDFFHRLLAQLRMEGKTVHDVRTALMGTWLSTPQISEEAAALVTGNLTEIANSIIF